MIVVAGILAAAVVVLAWVILEHARTERRMQAYLEAQDAEQLAASNGHPLGNVYPLTRSGEGE